MIHISRDEAAALSEAYDWFSLFAPLSPIGFASLLHPRPGAIHFVAGDRAANRLELPEGCLLLLPPGSANAEHFTSAAVVNPRAAFCHAFELLREIRYGNVEFVQYRGAQVAKGTHIPDDCRIESGAVIYPDVTLSQGCRIGANAVLCSGVTLGEGCSIGHGAQVGVDGFGYAFPEGEIARKIPHLGGTVVGDGVDIGANCVICAGTITPTRIGEGSKLDGMVFVGHNAEIGKRTMVCGGALVGGSTTIGDDVWLHPSATVRPKTTIGNNAVIGQGSIVMNTVLDGDTVMGDSANEIRSRFRRNRQLDKLLKRQSE
jgi:UDP-3-O-[3-hydroxymyristoyl] glucosamine N-acyltransferase LpxD